MTEFERIRDRDLLKQFRAGDREGFAELYRIHSRAVFRFALYVTADQNKAAEVTQDVFVWLVHHADHFDPARGELERFLVGVARNVMRRRFSEEHRWVELDQAIASPQKASAEPQDVRLLRNAVAALPQRYREVVALCDLEEKSYEEAAAALECAVGTVRFRLHRARALLAQKLGRNGKKKAEECRA